MDENIFYSLALSYCKGVGVISLKKMITHLGSPKAVWFANNNDLLNIDNIGINKIKDFGNDKYLKIAEDEIRFAKKNNLTILYYKTDGYPLLLNQCLDAPLILFTKGNINFNSYLPIGFVGTRKMTIYGKNFINEIVEELANYPVMIISGLAYGVDITSHLASISNNIPTIGILAHGLSKIYPAIHKPIADKMLSHGGIITEFSSFQEPIREHFLQRNRIIAGISKATIIVESAIYGGALTTAKYANTYNREVFALPGRKNDKYSQGCNFLIKSHQAQLIESIKDLAYHLNLDQKSKKTQQIELALNLTMDQQSIYHYLEKNGKTQIDQLAKVIKKPTHELSSLLLELELMGIASALPGSFFEVC
jgi:DNA processing protein